MSIVLSVGKSDVESNTEERLPVVMKMIKHSLDACSDISQYYPDIFELLHLMISRQFHLCKETRKKAVKLIEYAFTHIRYPDQEYYVMFLNDFADHYTTELHHMRLTIWELIEHFFSDQRERPADFFPKVAPHILRMMKMEEYENINSETHDVLGAVVTVFSMLLEKIELLMPSQQEELLSTIQNWLKPNGWFMQLSSLQILEGNRNEVEQFLLKIETHAFTQHLWEKYKHEPHITQLMELIKQ